MEAEKVVKSILVCRARGGSNGDRDMEHPYKVIIKLFDFNDPHLTQEFPKEEFEIDKIDEVEFRNFSMFSLLTFGNDILVNDLKKIKIRQVGNKVIIEKIE